LISRLRQPTCLTFETPGQCDARGASRGRVLSPRIRGHAQLFRPARWRRYQHAVGRDQTSRSYRLSPSGSRSTCIAAFSAFPVCVGAPSCLQDSGAHVSGRSCHQTRPWPDCRGRTVKRPSVILPDLPASRSGAKGESTALKHHKSCQIDGRVLRTGAANLSALGLKREDNDLTCD
jgi:hypothetical protein